MSAGRLWVGVDSLLRLDLAPVMVRPGTTLCGRSSHGESLRQAIAAGLAAAGASAHPPEWHDVGVDTTVGLGYVSDLLRQRAPLEHIVLVLPEWDNALNGSPPLDEVLAHAHSVVSAVITLVRGARTALSEGGAAGMTLLTSGEPPKTPAGAALSAFVTRYVSEEAATFQERGLSLMIVSQQAWQPPLINDQ